MSDFNDKILKMFKSGKIPPGQLTQVKVQHDDCCAFLRGGKCGCNPDVEIIVDKKHAKAKQN